MNKPQTLHEFYNHLFILASKGLPHLEFVEKILDMILELLEVEYAAFWLEGYGKYLHYRLETRSLFRVKRYLAINRDQIHIPDFDASNPLNGLRWNVLLKEPVPPGIYRSRYGSVWAADLRKKFEDAGTDGGRSENDVLANYSSAALVPLDIGDKVIGILELGRKVTEAFSQQNIDVFENLAQITAIALINKNILGALRERIKELTCLYSISRIMEKRDLSIPETMESILMHIPPAWQYPEITSARITLDGDVFVSRNYKEAGQKQRAPILAGGRERGALEVVYNEEKPVLDEGPFLREERKLITALAQQIAGFVERKEVERERQALQEQLRHADRLATIGQLAAGVAHELNEPLGNILGFAQLVQKSGDLSSQDYQDVERIVQASIQAREIIRKLMIFARQTPHKMVPFDVNHMIEEGLYFFEMRCLKSGIALNTELNPDLPLLRGDESQLNQVVVNLVVNAIQAMPEGGNLAIQTFSEDGEIHLVVEDTGIGMTEDIKEKIFIPFFTTKDVNEGTGLGLAVVHGIISTHKGNITVSSMPGAGSRFEIVLPVHT